MRSHLKGMLCRLPISSRERQNTLWIVFERILRLAVNLFVWAMIARHLGPESLGHLSYALAFASLIHVLGAFGLGDLLTRELVKDSDRINTLIGTVFILRLLIAMPILSLLAVFLYQLPDPGAVRIVVFIISAAILFQNFNVIDSYFQSIVQSRFVVKCQLATLILSSSLKLSLIYYDASLVWIALSYLVDAIFYAATLCIVYTQERGNLFRWSFDARTARQLLKESLPLLIAGFAILSYMKTDQLMLNWMHSPIEVGYYGAALRLTEAWLFVPIALVTSLFPGIVQARAGSAENFQSKMQDLYNMATLLSFSAGVVFLFASELVTELVYGENYSRTALIMQIHGFCGIFILFRVISGKWLLIENLTKHSLYRSLVGVVFNVVFNYIFIPKWGAVGAAACSLATYVVVGYLYDFLLPLFRSQAVMKSKALLIPLSVKSIFCSKSAVVRDD